MTLQAPEREAIRAKLLQCLANEADNSVRSKVGDAVAELARQHTDEGRTLFATLHGRILTNLCRRCMAGTPGRIVPGQPVAGPRTA